MPPISSYTDNDWSWMPRPETNLFQCRSRTNRRPRRRGNGAFERLISFLTNIFESSDWMIDHEVPAEMWSDQCGFLYVITRGIGGNCLISARSQICSNDDAENLGHFIRCSFAAAQGLRGRCNPYYTRCLSATHFSSMFTTLVFSGKRDLPWTRITCQWRRSRSYTVSSFDLQI